MIAAAYAVGAARDIASSSSAPFNGVTVGSDGLEDGIAHCGRCLEAAMVYGDRVVALVWMDAMYGLIRVRNSRVVPADSGDISMGRGC